MVHIQCMYTYMHIRTVYVVTCTLSLPHLWCGKALHDGDEGEEVAVGPTLEHEGEVDEPAKDLCPLQCIPSTDDAQNHCLGETQVSVGGSTIETGQPSHTCTVYIHVHGLDIAPSDCTVSKLYIELFVQQHLYLKKCTVYIHVHGVQTQMLY